MKLFLTMTVASAVLAASPALAQSAGFNPPPGAATKPRPGTVGGVSPYVPTYRPPSYAPSTTPAKPKTYGAPDPGGGFKPYEPYKPGSVYASPKPPSSGAKPCETSVYVNACDKRR